MTPYEILMDDIRSRRYKLNKIMVDGEIPQMVKKDAHNIILEFIRSRPPLRPVRDFASNFTYLGNTVPTIFFITTLRHRNGQSSQHDVSPLPWNC